ncbi:DgyrCDS2761 [Dimorphilus gyrociliatus]|uniref:DgyrCDS2761 n=1 Tax=Dimorphilus gyrociliatus TaxID=2664684 RepID=A0A7I8VD62_9ANNE|nr:DgyrCDS2761 [Dimorphilus gyrociliatus]
MARHSFRDFLHKHLRKNDIPHLQWIDENKQTFQVPWPKKDSKEVQGKNIFHEWAVLNNRDRPFSDQKHNVRAAFSSAIKKSKYLELVESTHANSENIQVKIYRFIGNDEQSPTEAANITPGYLLNEVIPQNEDYSYIPDLGDIELQPFYDTPMLSDSKTELSQDLFSQTENMISPSSISDSPTQNENSDNIRQNCQLTEELCHYIEDSFRESSMEIEQHAEVPALTIFPLSSSDKCFALLGNLYETDKYKLKLNVRIKDSMICETLETDTERGFVISPQTTNFESRTMAIWPGSQPVYISDKNLYNLNETRYKNFQKIHNNMLHSFGFRAEYGNIFYSRRCQVSVVCSDQNQRDGIIQLRRPMGSVLPFSDPDVDTKIFDLEIFLNQLTDYMNKRGQAKPFPGVKFCVGAKVTREGEIRDQLINGEVISPLAEELFKLCNKSPDGETSSIYISKSNEGDDGLENYLKSLNIN